MGELVVTGALIECAMGVAPVPLVATPSPAVMGAGPPVATIQDSKPMVNIPTFGMCNSPSNPTVAAATAAALGVLTPMPCIPNVVGPWAPGSPTVLIGNQPALTKTSMAMCAYGGVIKCTSPGQATITVP